MKTDTHQRKQPATLSLAVFNFRCYLAIYQSSFGQLRQRRVGGLLTMPELFPGRPALPQPAAAMIELLFRNEWQQPDESRSQNGLPHSSLKQSCRTSPATRQNASFTVNQRPQCLQVLVIHIDRTWNYTTSCELAAHFLLLQPCTTFAKLLQICSGNCCHEKTYYLLKTENLRAETPSKPRHRTTKRRPPSPFARRTGISSSGDYTGHSVIGP